MTDASLDDDTLAQINDFRQEVDNDPSLSEQISNKLFGDGINLAEIAQERGYSLSSEDFLAWIDHVGQNESTELHDFELALVAGGGSGGTSGNTGSDDCEVGPNDHITCGGK